MIQDKQEMLKLVRIDGMNLRLAFWNLREDRDLVLAAVKNNPYSIQFASDELQEDEELLSYVIKNDEYYFSLIDDNGYRYSIPFLNTSDQDYYSKYINYMKIKERSPDTFEKIARWD